MLRIGFAKFILGGAVALSISAAGCGAERPAPRRANYAVIGTVTDGAGLPLRHATVAIEGVPLGAFSDSLGRFSIEPVREGDYKLLVLHLGYRSAPFLLPAHGPMETSGIAPLIRDPTLGPAYADSLTTVQLVYRVETRP